MATVRTNMPMDLLRTFVAVADLGSVTRAGATLGRSQPAVSLQLRRLEEIVGVTLWRRDNRAVELTAAGRELAEDARRILEVNDDALDRLRRRHRGKGARLGLPNDLAGLLLPDLLPLLAPAQVAGLEVSCDLSGALLDAFGRGGLDVVLAMHDAPPPMGRDVVKAWEVELAWVAGTPPKPRRGGAVPLVLYPEGCRYRERITAVLEAGGRAFEVVYSSSSLAAIQAALKAGLGITVLARRAIPDGLAQADADGLPPLAPAAIALHAREATLPPVGRRLVARIVATLDAHFGA